MTSPNLFMVGAPKCGTTAMYEYLRAHPDIYMPGKEMHHFGSDIVRNIPDRETYLQKFAGWQGEKWRGDSSVWYMVSRRAAYEIKAFEPAAKIIIMLRDPVSAVYSLYSELVFRGFEDLPTFEEALAAEPEREQGRHIPQDCHRPEALLYHDVMRFADQVCRYFDAFGREQVHVIIFDDFKADLPGVYRQTLEFLDVEPDFVPDFKIHNPNKVVRFKALRDFKRNPPHWYNNLLAVGRVFTPTALRRAYSKRLTGLLTRYEPRAPMNPQLRQQLQADFLPDVERLSDLLGRDLTHWCR